MGDDGYDDDGVDAADADADGDGDRGFDASPVPSRSASGSGRGRGRNPLAPALSADSPLVVAPSPAALGAMTDAELAAVSGLTITHPKFGRVEWLSPVDLRGVNLSAAVVFERHVVEVITTREAAVAAAVAAAAGPETDNEEEEEEHSAAVAAAAAGVREGSWAPGLARPARVTLFGCWPKAARAGPGAGAAERDEYARALRRYEAKLRASNEKTGVRFEEYEPEEGAWTFSVPTF
jgi:hypothetical protein